MEAVPEITFILTFVRAEGLISADLNGLSDPYAEIVKDQGGFQIPKEHKTKFISNTLNPVWNESFTLKRLYNISSYNELKIEVYDHDYIGHDDLLGIGSINLDFLRTMRETDTSQMWINLSHPEKKKGSKGYVQVSQGRVLIEIRLAPSFKPGRWIPIDKKKIYVGLGWDFVSKNEVFDLDSSVAGFDELLAAKDYAFYGKLSGFGGAIKHKGDNLTGEGSGDDEVISVDLDDIPKNIIYLAVCVNSYRGNSMIKAKSAYIRLFDKNKEIGKYILARTKDCIGLLLGLFSRKPGTNTWFFRVMADPLEGNQITTSIASIRELLTGYPLNTVSLNNSSISSNPLVSKHPLPGEQLFSQGGWFEVKCATTYVGLGWDFKVGETYDLDSSAISFDTNNEALDIVYHKNLNSLDKSIIHRGDNKLGFGEGDDEVIQINFPQVDVRVSTIAIIANSFKGNSLVGVKNGFIRIFDQAGPIGCHLIGNGRDIVGMMLGLFRRNPNTGGWFFTTMIEALNGTIATECIGEVKFLLDHYSLPAQLAQPVQPQPQA